MYRLLLVCCLLLTVSFKPDGKVVKKNQPTIKVVKAAKVYHTRYDSSKVNVRHFDATAIDKYRNSPGFDYNEKAKAGMSWWKKLWIWIWEMIAKLFQGGPSAQTTSIPYMQYLLAALTLGLLIYVIVKMAGLNLANIFNRGSREINIPYTESLENIHQITFDEEIEKALNQRNYRLAIRLLYLSTLKQLNDAHFIQWQVDKTNSAYINELADTEKRRSFSLLTRQFEYVWYGDFPVDGPSFQHINTLFHDFKRTLK